VPLALYGQSIWVVMVIPVLIHRAYLPPQAATICGASPARHLWHFSIFDLWSRPWAWPDYWVSMDFLHAPIPQKGPGSTTTTICEDYFTLSIF